MSLVDFIEKLQKKPRHQKIQIMWVGVVLGSIIIFIFWFWSLAVLLAEAPKADDVNSQKLNSLNQLKSDVPSLWQSLGAGISGVVNTAKEDFSNPPLASPSPSGEAQGQEEKLPIEQ